MEGVFVRYIRLPWTVRAVTIPNDDETYDVYINSVLSEEWQAKALRHELKHIRLGHFYDKNRVYINEAEAG